MTPEHLPNLMVRFQRWVTSLLVAVLTMIGSAGCSKEFRKNRYLERANREFTAEQYEKAELEYLWVLQVAPLNPIAVRRLGVIYHEQGRLPRAIAYLRKATELEPDNLEVRLKLGLNYMSVGQFKEAGGEARRILEKQPGHEEALLLLADSAITSKQILETRQRIEELRQQDQDRAGYHLALGGLHLRQHDLNKAASEFRKALALDPKSGAVQQSLGNLHWMQDDLPEAERAFKTAADLAPLRSARRLRYAEFKLKTGATEEAKQALEEITRKVPDYLPAWTYLMQVSFAERKYEDCANLIQKVLAKDSANFEALMLGGNLLLVRGEGAKEVAEFERINSIYGRVPRARYQLALAQLLNNDFGKAVRSLNRALALDPNLAEAILLLAELNIRKSNPSPAITSLTQLVKQRPQIAQAHLLLANAYLVQKNPDEAVAVYKRMAGFFPKNPQVPLLMGSVLAQQNKRTEARQAFATSLELASDYLPALEQLVDLDIVDKQFTNAMERVKQQMEKKPGAAEMWLLLAKVHLAQGEVNQAESALLKAIGMDPDLRDAYLLLAELYVTSNRHQQALDKLVRLVGKTNDVPALMLIGMIHEQSRSFSAARESYEKLLAINPKFSPALNNLAYLYSEHFGQLDKAYLTAEKARQLLPYDPHIADTLGWILYKKGEYPRALGLLQESAWKLPVEPEVQFHLGMTHYLMGEEETARLALERALQGNKEFPGKEEGRRRLSVLAIDTKTNRPAALAEVEVMLRQEPDDPVALGRLAAIQVRNGAMEKAAKTYERALKINPGNARLLVNLAQLYSGPLKDPRQALALSKEAHNLAPEDPFIAHTLGCLVFQAGDYQWSLSLLQESARKLARDPDVFYDLAWACYAVGQVSDAETNMQSALQAGATPAHFEEAKRFLSLIASSHNPARAREALAQAEQILAADPAYVPALVILATVHEQEGRYAQAKQLHERILDHYPLFVPATRQLALLYAGHFGNDEKAYELAVKARSAFPDDPELARTLGILSYRRRDYVRSAQLLKESIRKWNNDAELAYYLGMAHYRLKERKESKEALLRAVALNDQAPFAEEAKRVITELK